MAAMHTVILTNISGSDQLIEDLGITIVDSTNQVTISNFYTFDELAGSDDLRTIVGNGDFTVNDGSDDLIAAEGVKYLTIETLYDLEEEYYSAVELSSPGQSTIHWDNVTNAPSFGSLSWVEPVEYRVLDISSAAPGGPSNGDVYIDTDDNHYYKYDGSWQDEDLAVSGARVINLADGQEDIYTFGGSSWTASDSTSSESASVIVNDDGDGKSAQYIYDPDTLSWRKIGDIDFTGHFDGGASKHDASEIDVESAYSNIGSDAEDDLETVIGDIDTKCGVYDGHLDGGANKHDATEIDDENTYTNIQGSPTDVDATLTAIDGDIGNLNSHIDGGDNKHDASEIDVENTYTNIGNDGTADTVEEVLGDIDTQLGTTLDHLDGGANKHDADEIDDENTYTNILGSPTDVDATLTAIDTALGLAGDHNTLDEAYDEGGAGAGRTITADTGPVKIDRGASTDASFEIAPKAGLPSTNLADGQIDNKSGILCVYDNSRTKFLSIARPLFVFGRRRATYDQYLNFFVGTLASNNSGLRIPRDATIVSLTAQLDASGTCTFQIERNGAGISIASLAISATTFAVQTNTNVDVSAGDYLQCYINSSPSVQDPIIMVELAWRP